jgi:hypothetical protein
VWIQVLFVASLALLAVTALYGYRLVGRGVYRADYMRVAYYMLAVFFAGLTIALFASSMMRAPVLAEYTIVNYTLTTITYTPSGGNATETVLYVPILEYKQYTWQDLVRRDWEYNMIYATMIVSVASILVAFAVGLPILVYAIVEKLTQVIERGW